MSNLNLRFSRDSFPGLLAVIVGLVFLIPGIIILNLGLVAFGGIIVLFGAIDMAAWLSV